MVFFINSFMQYILIGNKDLTTEEFYAAVNRKIRDVKKRSQDGGKYDRESASSYLSSLNKKK